MYTWKKTRTDTDQGLEILWRDNDGHCCRPQHVLCSKSSFWNRWVNKQTLNFEELRSKIPTSNIYGWFFPPKTQKNHGLFLAFFVGRWCCRTSPSWTWVPLASSTTGIAASVGCRTRTSGSAAAGTGELGPLWDRFGSPETAGRCDDFGCHAKVGQALVTLDILFKLSIIHNGKNHVFFVHFDMFWPRIEKPCGSINNSKQW